MTDALTLLLEEATTRDIIACFRNVHRALGFGYREYIYSLALERDLVARGHRVEREVRAVVYYRSEPLATQIMDMVVDGKVIVENKASERLHQSAMPQLFGYLCATNFQVGLLLHYGRQARFHRAIYENGLKRRSAS